MAKIKLLVDTDVIIDCLRGLKQAKNLFRSNEIDIHCSILSKKELLSKTGLSDNERKRITKLMNQIKVFKIDGVVKSPIYCVAAHFEILDILYV